MATNLRLQRELIALALSVSPESLTRTTSPCSKTELWVSNGVTYCAPRGWRRPPGKREWRMVGYAGGTPVFMQVRNNRAIRYASDAMAGNQSDEMGVSA